MINRILEQQQPICATLLALHKGEFMQSNSEFATMEAFVYETKPLIDIHVHVTEAIGREKWITIFTIRPILHKLLQSSFLPSSNDNQQVKNFKHLLLTDLHVQERYTGDLLLFSVRIPCSTFALKASSLDGT